MDVLYSLFLAIGVATFAYTKFARRAGYGNAQSILIVIAATFVITFIVGITVFKFILHI
jgi:hypothetical protein